MSAPTPTTHSQFLQTYVKSSFLDRNRELVITNEYIEFDDNDLISAEPTRFIASDIKAFRYGIK